MTTVPKPPDNSEPPNRRQVLAFIALADIPMPESIRFYDQYPFSLDIAPGDDLDLTPLMALFGVAGQEIRRQRYDLEEHGKQGFILKVDCSWRGWSVLLRGWATDGKTGPADEELDADTRARLEQVADAPDLDMDELPPVGVPSHPDVPAVPEIADCDSFVIRDGMSVRCAKGRGHDGDHGDFQSIWYEGDEPLAGTEVGGESVEDAAPYLGMSDRVVEAIGDLLLHDAKLRGYEDPAITEHTS